MVRSSTFELIRAIISFDIFSFNSIFLLRCLRRSRFYRVDPYRNIETIEFVIKRYPDFGRRSSEIPILLIALFLDRWHVSYGRFIRQGSRIRTASKKSFRNVSGENLKLLSGGKHCAILC